MAESFDIEGLRSAIRDADADWEAGETSVSTLSPEERRTLLGYVPGPGEPELEERERMGAAALAQHRQATAPAVPAAWDWRNAAGRNYITPVKNQASCGSCVAFGATAAVEGTAQVIHTPSAVDLSEASLFYCVAEAQQGRTCATGWWVSDAMNAYQNIGVPGDSCFPYTPGDQPCNQCKDWASRALKIKAWRLLSDVASMKAWISTRGPIATCFTVYSDFYNYRSGVYKYASGGLVGGHCVCVVGYDDAHACWICKNSWGTNWGEGGFFRIEYGQCGIDAAMWAVDGIAALGPAPGSGSPIAAMPTKNGDPRVYFTGTDGDVHQLAWESGNWAAHWAALDLTQVTGAPKPVAGSAIAAMAIENGDPRVYFTGTDGDVHQLAWEGGNWAAHWAALDLTQVTGAPKPVAGSPIAAMPTKNGDPRVYFTGTDGDVHQLAWESGNWAALDLTQVTGAPKPVAGSPIAAMPTKNGDPRVYFTGTDGDVHQLAWEGHWTTRDLTLSTYL